MKVESIARCSTGSLMKVESKAECSTGSLMKVESVALYHPYPASNFCLENVICFLPLLHMFKPTSD